MRDPVFVPAIQADILSPSASLSWLSSPSFSGIAFAAVAASLPLLSENNVKNSSGKKGY